MAEFYSGPDWNELSRNPAKTNGIIDPPQGELNPKRG